MPNTLPAEFKPMMPPTLLAALIEPEYISLVLSLGSFRVEPIVMVVPLSVVSVAREISAKT